MRCLLYDQLHIIVNEFQDVSILEAVPHWEGQVREELPWGYVQEALGGVQWSVDEDVHVRVDVDEVVGSRGSSMGNDGDGCVDVDGGNADADKGRIGRVQPLDSTGFSWHCWMWKLRYWYLYWYWQWYRHQYQ